MPGEVNPATPAAPAAAPAAPAAPAAAAPAAPAAAPAVAAPPAEPVLRDPNAPAEPAKPAVAAPETYELKAPEGQQLDTAQIEAYTPLFKELGLSQDAAQKLVDKSFEIMPKLMEARDAQIQQEIAKEDAARVKATREDPEFGGDKFEASAKVANAALAKFARPGLAKKLLEAGLASDPDMVHLLWNVGQKLGESTPPPPGSSPSASSTASVLYPSMNKH